MRCSMELKRRNRESFEAKGAHLVLMHAGTLWKARDRTWCVPDLPQRAVAFDSQRANVSTVFLKYPRSLYKVSWARWPCHCWRVPRSLERGALRGSCAARQHQWAGRGAQQGLRNKSWHSPGLPGRRQVSARRGASSVRCNATQQRLSSLCKKRSIYSRQ